MAIEVASLFASLPYFEVPVCLVRFGEYLTLWDTWGYSGVPKMDVSTLHLLGGYYKYAQILATKLISHSRKIRDYWNMIYINWPYPFGIGSVAKECVIKACLTWDHQQELLPRIYVNDVFQKHNYFWRIQRPIMTPPCLEINFFNQYQFTTWNI